MGLLNSSCQVKSYPQERNKVVEYKNVEQIVVYTNATILPKDENFECLKNKKVRLHITNYGLMSRKHDELVDLCQKNKIKFVSERVKKWQDVGTINFEKKNWRTAWKFV